MGDLFGFAQMPDIEVGGAEITDLTAAHYVVEGASLRVLRVFALGYMLVDSIDLIKIG